MSPTVTTVETSSSSSRALSSMDIVKTAAAAARSLGIAMLCGVDAVSGVEARALRGGGLARGRVAVLLPEFTGLFTDSLRELTLARAIYHGSVPTHNGVLFRFL